MKTLKSRYVRYTVTAALPYANGPLHIGHLAGAYLPADIYARYLRLKGEDIVFVCGSDEHGAAITLRAKKEGVSPKEIVDKYHQLNKKTFEDFGIDFDIFHRTSSELHHKTAADFFKVLNDKDEFVQKTTEQYYDEEHRQFLADRYITGTCPKCDYGNAYGDQCEKCGSSLSPKELINPKSALSGNQPILKETKHWYLPMDKYESWLKEWIIEGHKDDWKPNVFGQCKSWIEGGLKQRAMTRDLDWGVKVPIEGAEGKVLYVWLDAPIGYISATKQWAADNNKNWEDYWKDKDTKLVHFIGKDNIVFHCIIFPILLKAHGGFILPDNVPANEFLNLEGDKFSTSRNWAVWLYEYLEDFPEKQDVLRYVLCANAPEAKDNDFTWREFQSRNNNELVANLGNFVNRVATLVHKYYNGKVPEYNVEDQIMKDCANPTYRGHIEQLLFKINQVNSYLEQYKFKLALHSLMEISAINGNLLLQENEPWKQIKTNPEHVKSVLNAAIQTVAVLSVLCQPFIPGTSSKIREILNLQPIQNGELKKLLKELRNENYIKPGHQLNKPELLFQKIEDWEVETQIQKLRKAKDKVQS